MSVYAEMHDGRRLEFPDGTDPAIIQATVKKLLAGGPKKSAVTPEWQQSAAISATRAAHPILSAVGDFATGASSMVRGGLNALQSEAQAIGGMGRMSPTSGGYAPDKIGDKLIPQMPGSEGSGYRTAGEFLDPAAWAIGGAGPGFARVFGGGLANAGKALLKNAAIGGAQGAAIGGLSEGGDSASGGALGAAAGAVLPPVFGAAGKIARGTGNILDLVTHGGPKRIADRYQKAIIGEEQIPKVIDALRSQGNELVAGSKPTVSQAVSQVPEASPLVAHQAVTAKTSGGISSKFGQRTLDQRAARKAAETRLDEITGPMREAAINAANVRGVNADMVLSRIDESLNKPGLRASSVVTKTLGETKGKILALAELNGGNIDANDLYTIRKELYSTIKTFSKETANWDKRLTGSLERDLQLAIDDAIESSGGKGWKQYIDTHAKGKRAIQQDIERTKLALRPLQRTALSGGDKVTDSVQAHIPQLLSRPAMIANAILRRLGYAIEPRVDAIMAERYLDPEALASALEQATKPQRAQILAEMAKQAAIRGTIIGASNGAQANQ